MTIFVRYIGVWRENLQTECSDSNRPGQTFLAIVSFRKLMSLFIIVFLLRWSLIHIQVLQEYADGIVKNSISVCASCGQMLQNVTNDAVLEEMVRHFHSHLWNAFFARGS